MKQPVDYYKLLVFILGCTVCTVLIVNILAAFLLKIPTTPDNLQIRMQLVDLLKYIAGGVLAILSAKLVGTVTKDKDEK